MKIRETDVLVIGSGLAGLYTSLHLDPRLKVTIISKDIVSTSNSSLAQGGIAGCMRTEDSTDAHAEDTFKAGSFTNDQDAVHMLVENAPSEILKLIELGVEFDKDEDGIILTTLEGGHSQKRILHAKGDATGKVIMDTVIDQIKRCSNVELHELSMVIKLLKVNNAVYGALLIDKGETILLKSKKTVIASGGIGALYTSTTNQSVATGDGIALAYEVGAVLSNLCLIQFHPTALYLPHSDTRFLISEAVRGEGAYLLDSQHQRFMPSLHPLAELAPRDVVAQCIHQRMLADNTDHLYLDCRHLGDAFLQQRFPTIYGALLEAGITMGKDLIPITPVSHYFIGGIQADLNGQTTITNLYACGEVSHTGVHGANRLASNSLLECVVFGKRVAIDINRCISPSSESEFQWPLNQEQLHELEVYENKENHDNDQQMSLHLIQKNIRSLMTRYVGIVRDDEQLSYALKLIDTYKTTIRSFRCLCPLYYETKNMLTVSRLIIEDALKMDSVGCHYKQNNSEVIQHANA